MKKSKKILSLALAAASIAGSALPALADESINADGGNATTNLTIEAAATQLNVTVPTALHISVNNATEATVGKGYVENGSTGVVEVKSITLTNSEYTLETYAAQSVFSAYDVGSKKLGLSIAFGEGADNSDQPELTGAAVTYVTGTDFTSGTEKVLSAGTLKIASPADSANHNNKLYINPTASVSPTGATAIEAASNVTAATMTLVVGWYTGA